MLANARNEGLLNATEGPLKACERLRMAPPFARFRGRGVGRHRGIRRAATFERASTIECELEQMEGRLSKEFMLHACCIATDATAACFCAKYTTLLSAFYRGQRGLRNGQTREHNIR
jgi:hypothetical protein